jgi:nucleoside 2-deoxyribosyltransferase
MATQFSRLFFHGFGPDEPMLALLRGLSRQQMMQEPQNLTNALEMQVGDLVVVEYRNDTHDVIGRLLAKEVKVVLYIPEGEVLRPNVIISLFSKGLLYCCCQSVAAKKGGKEVGDRLSEIIEGKQPYQRLCTAKPDTVFLATPLDDNLYDPFLQAARSALSPLHIKIRNPPDEPGAVSIPEKVRKAIDGSELVIANLTLIDRDNEKGFNPNVMFEIGYAVKARKRVLAFRQFEDRLEIPTDIAGHEYHRYHDSIDLALLLFYGFGGPETGP